MIHGPIPTTKRHEKVIIKVAGVENVKVIFNNLSLLKKKINFDKSPGAIYCFYNFYFVGFITSYFIIKGCTQLKSKLSYKHEKNKENSRAQ